MESKYGKWKNSSNNKCQKSQKSVWWRDIKKVVNERE